MKHISLASLISIACALLATNSQADVIEQQYTGHTCVMTGGVGTTSATDITEGNSVAQYLPVERLFHGIFNTATFTRRVVCPVVNTSLNQTVNLTPDEMDFRVEVLDSSPSAVSCTARSCTASSTGVGSCEVSTASTGTTATGLLPIILGLDDSFGSHDVTIQCDLPPSTSSGARSGVVNYRVEQIDNN